jgi:hypothetical protein
VVVDVVHTRVEGVWDHVDHTGVHMEHMEHGAWSTEHADTGQAAMCKVRE